MAVSDPLAVTSGQLARLVGVTLKTIHRWVDSQELQGWQTDGRHRRFHRTEVVRLLRRLKAPVPRALADTPCHFIAVGFDAPSELERYAQVGSAVLCDGFFDAALVMGAGHFELCLIDVERFELRWTAALLAALRRRPSTAGMASLGVAQSALMRRAFLRHGGDAAIPDLSEVDTTLSYLVGGAVAPSRLLVRSNAADDALARDAHQPASRSSRPSRRTT
jgi:excisionase family DNA binding protein